MQQRPRVGEPLPLDLLNTQWCSMAGCGNRVKARRHYARRTGDGG